MTSVTNNIVSKDEMWLLTREEKKYMQRIIFLNTFIKPNPPYCPECGTKLIHEDDETYCPRCGLITSASIEYVAGQKINLPYGRH